MRIFGFDKVDSGTSHVLDFEHRKTNFGAGSPRAVTTSTCSGKTATATKSKSSSGRNWVSFLLICFGEKFRIQFVRNPEAGFAESIEFFLQVYISMRSSRSMSARFSSGGVSETTSWLPGIFEVVGEFRVSVVARYLALAE